MPLIPTFTSRQPIDAPLMPVNAQPRANPAAMAAPTEEIARAAMRTSALFADLATQERQARQAGEVASARAQHAEALAELRGQIETAEAGTDILGAWDTGRTQVRDRIAQNIQDPRVRALFVRDATEREASARLDVVRFSARRTAESQRAAMDGELEVWANQAAAARDPAARAQAVEAAMGAIAARVATGVLPADDGQKLQRSFRGRMAQAEAIRDINGNPSLALGRLADLTQYRGLDEIQRERLAAQARTALQTRATQADTAMRREEHQARIRANEADKAFQDAQRSGDVAAQERALEVLRRDGQPGQYASAADSLYGRREPPTTPAMEAWLEDRLRHRGQPLTRAELEEARGKRQINDTVYRRGLERLSGREDARFREAEQFIERALDVPSSTIPDAQLRPWQQTARRQANSIVNDLVVARRGNADVDPLAFVQERLRTAEDPIRVNRREQARDALGRQSVEFRTPEGLAAISQQWTAYEQAKASRGWFSSAPQPPRLSNGTLVTADMIARARALQIQAELVPTETEARQ